jgi:hypothetical protein
MHGASKHNDSRSGPPKAIRYRVLVIALKLNRYTRYDPVYSEP